MRKKILSKTLAKSTKRELLSSLVENSMAGEQMSTPDVELDCVVEEDNVLRHHSHDCSQALLLQPSQVLTVQTNAAADGVVQAVDKPHDCAFAAACGPH